MLSCCAICIHSQKLYIISTNYEWSGAPSSFVNNDTFKTTWKSRFTSEHEAWTTLFPSAWAELVFPDSDHASSDAQLSPAHTHTSLVAWSILFDEGEPGRGLHRPRKWAGGHLDREFSYPATWESDGLDQNGGRCVCGGVLPSLLVSSPPAPSHRVCVFGKELLKRNSRSGSLESTEPGTGDPPTWSKWDTIA